MKYEVLDVVMLDRDIPDHGLRKGHLGTVVEIYEPDGLEVEFAGRLAAPITLTVRDVVPVDDDHAAVRIRHGRG